MKKEQFEFRYKLFDNNELIEFNNLSDFYSQMINEMLKIVELLSDDGHVVSVSGFKFINSENTYELHRRESALG